MNLKKETMRLAEVINTQDSKIKSLNAAVLRMQKFMGTGNSKENINPFEFLQEEEKLKHQLKQREEQSMKLTEIVSTLSNQIFLLNGEQYPGFSDDERLSIECLKQLTKLSDQIKTKDKIIHDKEFQVSVLEREVNLVKLQNNWTGSSATVNTQNENNIQNGERWEETDMNTTS